MRALLSGVFLETPYAGKELRLRGISTPTRAKRDD